VGGCPHPDGTYRCVPSKKTTDLAFYANVWHEVDDREAELVKAGRILRPEGRVAILDWRPDVDPSSGQPLEHRVSVADVHATLRNTGWNAGATFTVGSYSYLVVATHTGLVPR
jgi:SAM-dependent methyltransferase